MRALSLFPTVAAWFSKREASSNRTPRRTARCKSHLHFLRFEPLELRAMLTGELMALQWAGGYGSVTTFSGNVAVSNTGGNAWAGGGIDDQGHLFTFTAALPHLTGTSTIDLVIEGLAPELTHWAGTGASDPLTRPWNSFGDPLHTEDCLFDGLWGFVFDEEDTGGSGDGSGGHAPTAIALTPMSVDENQPADTLVGSLTATDADAGDTHTFELVEGAGSTDNVAFSISGNQLRTTDTFNYEFDNSYSIRVRVTDSAGLQFETALTIGINDLNEAPTSIGPASHSVAENSPAGTVVASLTASDPDAGDSHTFDLVIGGGDADNSLFVIVGAELRTAVPFDFEEQSVRSVRVRATDAGGLTYTQPLAIDINNVNEAPIAYDDEFPVDENTPNGTIVGAAEAADPDTPTTLTYSITGGNTSGAFSINSQTGEISVANSTKLNYEQQTSFTLVVTVSDGALSDNATIGVLIGDVNEAPDFQPGNDIYTVRLGRHKGAGEFDKIVDVFGLDVSKATDVDGDTLTYSLSSGDSGLFAVNPSTGQLSLKVPAKDLTGSTHTLTIDVTDGTLTDQATVNIAIVDTVGVGGDAHAVEGAGDGIAVKFVRYSQDPFASTLTVTYEIDWTTGIPGRAEPGDFAATQDRTDLAALSFTFGLGETVKTFSLDAVADGTKEGVETFTVTVLNGANGSYYRVDGAADMDKNKPSLDTYYSAPFSVLDGVTLFAKQDINQSPVDDVDGVAGLGQGDLDHLNPGIHINDIKQGGLGDCFLLAALIALTKENWQQIESRFSNETATSVDVELWNGQSWQTFEVPKNLERGFEMAQLSGDVDNAGKAEIWPILLERAYAQMVPGGYEAMNTASWGGDLYKALTGLAVDPATSTSGMTNDEIWDAINNARGSGKQVILHSKSVQPSYSLLAPHHGYFVEGIKQVDTNNDGTPDTWAYALRNPWGTDHYDLRMDWLDETISHFEILNNVP